VGLRVTRISARAEAKSAPVPYFPSSDSPRCEEFRVNNRRLNRLFRSMARNVGRELPRFGDAESPLEALCS